MRLKEYTIETPTHWIANDELEYPINEYANHAEGIKKWNPILGIYQIGLPNKYPYRIKYKTEPYFKCYRPLK